MKKQFVLYRSYIYSNHHLNLKTYDDIVQHAEKVKSFSRPDNALTHLGFDAEDTDFKYYYYIVDTVNKTII